MIARVEKRKTEKSQTGKGQIWSEGGEGVRIISKHLNWKRKIALPLNLKRKWSVPRYKVYT